MTAPLRILDGIDVTGKRVVVRTDLNVPMKNAASPTTRACAMPYRPWWNWRTSARS